jgi:hypothetical protein
MILAVVGYLFNRLFVVLCEAIPHYTHRINNAVGLNGEVCVQVESHGLAWASVTLANIGSPCFARRIAVPATCPV